MRFGTQSGIQTVSQRVVIYGPGGIGKSELAANLKQIGRNPLFFDIGTGTGFLDVDRVEPCPQDWDELRAALHCNELCAPYDSIVIDDLTMAETFAIAWTLKNVPKEKGDFAKSIEGYGWGKGYTHVYETFLQLLGDLDAHTRQGKMVICIAHECTSRVPNPTGDDWIRYEPRLQNTDKGNIRSRVKEWADHLFYIGYDVFAEDGKAKGGGTRTIYPAEMPTHLAKSRLLADPIPYSRGSADLWKFILKGKP